MMQTHGRRKGLASAGIVAGLLLLVAQSGWCEAPRSGARALVIGIDGASMRIIAPLIEAGELPRLAAIAEEGVSGVLQAPLPLSSPRIWNIVATGKGPEAHGIRGFAKQEKGERRLYLSTDRKVHAIWNIVSRAGLTVGVVNFWNTYPPEKINGVMVSDHVLSAEIEGRKQMSAVDYVPAGANIYPESWGERLLPLIKSSERATPFPDPLADLSGLPRWNRESGTKLSRRSGEDDALTRIAAAIEGELRPDLLMVLLPGIDRVSHHLWGGVEAAELYPAALRAPDAERAAAAKALRDYYRYTDALLGVLIERYQKDDLVLVLSDHGFEAGVPMQHLTGAHESTQAAEGVFFARGLGISHSRAPARLRAADVTPTLLIWLGLAIADDMEGKAAPFLSQSPAGRVATYDTAPIERLRAAPSGAEAEIIEQLRSLGYLE